MKFTCPHCKGHLESEDDLSGTFVQCPYCGKSFLLPSSLKSQQTSRQETVQGAQTERTAEGELDAANDVLERTIGYMLHAIWGIVKRIGHVIRWIVFRLYDLAIWLWRMFCDIVKFFFSLRFLKFLILLIFLEIVISVFVAIVIAPFYLWIWFVQGSPSATLRNLVASPLVESIQTAFQTMIRWLNGDGVASGIYICAWVVEIIWIVLFAGCGAWKGMKSYKDGVIARWRERYRIRRDARRARKAAERAAKEAAK